MNFFIYLSYASSYYKNYMIDSFNKNTDKSMFYHISDSYTNIQVLITLQTVKNHSNFDYELQSYGYFQCSSISFFRLGITFLVIYAYSTNPYRPLPNHDTVAVYHPKIDIDLSKYGKIQPRYTQLYVNKYKSSFRISIKKESPKSINTNIHRQDMQHIIQWQRINHIMIL